MMFQINRARCYNEGGKRRIFSQTILAEKVSDREYRVLEVVAEDGRPSFDLTSRPTGGTFLPEFPYRRFASGEWQELPE